MSLCPPLLLAYNSPCSTRTQQQRNTRLTFPPVPPPCIDFPNVCWLRLASTEPRGRDFILVLVKTGVDFLGFQRKVISSEACGCQGCETSQSPQLSPLFHRHHQSRGRLPPPTTSFKRHLATAAFWTAVIKIMGWLNTQQRTPSLWSVNKADRFVNFVDSDVVREHPTLHRGLSSQITSVHDPFVSPFFTRLNS